MRIVRAFLLLVALIAAAPALAQQSILQGGPWQPGHLPQYVGQGITQPIVQDGGGAGGGGLGINPSELGITSRAGRNVNTAPFASNGNGPLGEHACMYDGPTNSPTGYHYLCFDPNAQGGALIDYGAAGGATPLPLQFSVNGTAPNFPIVGTSGATVPLNNGNNTESGTWNFQKVITLSNTDFPSLLNINGSSLYHNTNYPAIGWEEALGVYGGAYVTRAGPNIKISRSENLDKSVCGNVTNEADCNAALAVYSWAAPSETIQGTALQAAAVGKQLIGPYNDTVGATFYAAIYPSGVTATPVFAASGNTVSGLNAAIFYAGTSVVFTDTGGSLPSGITAGLPYKIITASSTAATIGLLDPSGAPPVQSTWTGSGTGTQLATQGVADNKATGLYTSAKCYALDCRAISQEVNIINISGTDPVYDATDGDGFFGLLISCGGGGFIDPNYRACGNAIQITNDGKSWLVGVSVTGNGVTYADFDAEGSSSYGLLIGGNHTVSQIAGLHWQVGPTGDLIVETPDSAQAEFGSTGAHDSWVKIRNLQAGQQGYLDFVDGSTDKWEIVKTSGNNLGIFDSAANRFAINIATGAAPVFAASTTGAAAINLAQGVAPSSPANGDMWITSTGLYYRFNGTTHGPL